MASKEECANSYVHQSTKLPGWQSSVLQKPAEEVALWSSR